MKPNFVLLIALAFMSIAFCAFGATDTATEQGLGFLSVASNTLTVTGTPLKCPALPHGTLNIYVTAWGGDLLVGNSTDLATGTTWKAAGIIASGTTVKLDGIITQRPNIWFVRNSGTSATMIIAAWGTE